MSRKNRRKEIKRKTYNTGLPGKAPKKTRKGVSEKEAQIASPPLAVPNIDTYGDTTPKLPAQNDKQADCSARRDISPADGKRTVVFVDYEHWFYSMWSGFGIRPNIEEWYGFISDNNLLDVRFYADFSKEGIFKEIPRIRCVTNTVLDTRSPNAKSEKDFTDFIILNDLYRMCLQSSQVEKVILLTGDGHFSPAVAFLKASYGIETEVFGVKGCIHTSLRLAASALHELPGSFDYLLPCSKHILSYMWKVRIKASWYNFCFLSLAEQVSENYGYNVQITKDALETLIRQGYLYRDARYINGEKKSVLDVNWELAEKDGLMPKDATYSSTSLARPQTIAAAGADSSDRHTERDILPEVLYTPSMLLNLQADAENQISLVNADQDFDDSLFETPELDEHTQIEIDEACAQSDANALKFMQYYQQMQSAGNPSA